MNAAGPLADELPESGFGTFAEVALFAAQFDDQLLAHQLVPLLAVALQFLEQLTEADLRLRHHWLHLREILQGLVDAYRIEDGEANLADLFA
jgi:hypothetical protein